MATTPILTLSDFTTEFVVEANASNVGINDVLTQRGRPMAYFSKALFEKHQTLSVYEKRNDGNFGGCQKNGVLI